MAAIAKLISKTPVELIKPIFLNWSLATSAATADQQIGTTTPRLGDVLIVLAFIVEVYVNTPSATAALIGSLKVNWGLDTIFSLEAVNPTDSAPFGVVVPVPEGYLLLGDGNKALAAFCSPVDATTYTWKVTPLAFTVKR